MHLEEKRKQKNSFFYVWLFATCCWAAFIFSMSLQPADVSSETSLGFAAWLVETFLPDQQEVFETFSLEQVEFWHHILRKLAHFTEYTILGMSMLSTWLHSKVKNYFGKIGAAVCCICIASIDETIQLFVPGRSGQVKDVLLDSCGAVFGICFILVLIKIINGKRNRTVLVKNMQ